MAAPKVPPVPLHHRRVAREAFDRLVRDLGSRPAVAATLRVPVVAVERALYSAMAPTTFQKLLAYLQCDAEELVAVITDGGLPRKRPWPPIEEAILCAGRFAPGAKEKEIRAIADELQAELADRTDLEILERLLREINRRILEPQRRARVQERRVQAEKRRRGRELAARVKTESDTVH